MAEPLYTFRQATRSDVGAIEALVTELSGLGQLLPRTSESIETTIGHWRIALSEGQLIGCGSILPHSETLAEVRSLAVKQQARGNGLGGEILSALVDDAKIGKFETLFALTHAVPLFQRRGFEVGRRIQFPGKVWRDCLTCPVLLRCNETTVVLDLKSG